MALEEGKPIMMTLKLHARHQQYTVANIPQPLPEVHSTAIAALKTDYASTVEPPRRPASTSSFAPKSLNDPDF